MGRRPPGRGERPPLLRRDGPSRSIDRARRGVGPTPLRDPRPFFRRRAGGGGRPAHGPRVLPGELHRPHHPAHPGRLGLPGAPGQSPGRTGLRARPDRRRGSRNGRVRPPSGGGRSRPGRVGGSAGHTLRRRLQRPGRGSAHLLLAARLRPGRIDSNDHLVRGPDHHHHTRPGRRLRGPPHRQRRGPPRLDGRLGGDPERRHLLLRDRRGASVRAAPVRAPSPSARSPPEEVAMRPLWLSLLLAAGCVHAPPTGATPPEPHTVTAEDGWPLALWHYPPSPGAPARVRPVLLCHGLGSNHVSLDLEPGGSLARYLEDQGYDVWALDWRGHGGSRARPKGGETNAHRSFDDYVRLDAPAAIRYVLRETGAKGVSWVGHSMGGMVAYAYLGRGGPGVDALVTIASPADLSRSGLLHTTARLSFLEEILPQVYNRVPGEIHAALGGFFPFHLNNLVYNRANLEPRERRLLLGTALENISRGELKEFCRWEATGGRFDSNDGKDDYGAELSHIRCPALFLSGIVDRLVPPPSVQLAFVRLASADKTHRCFGIFEGDRHDFGHVDLASGKAAREEVYPVISAWLAAHDPI